MTITDKQRGTTRGPRRRANVAAVLLFLGTVVLVAGAAVAVALPSSMMFWRGSAHPTAEPAYATSAPSATSSPSGAPASSPPSPSGLSTTAPSASPTPPSKQPATPRRKRTAITYTVKRGDTLSGIAAWFKLHGYQQLFTKNRGVIGSDPDLIRPGERITINRDGAMTITRSK